VAGSVEPHNGKPLTGGVRLGGVTLGLGPGKAGKRVADAEAAGVAGKWREAGKQREKR
jgi:hypothetical protein